MNKQKAIDIIFIYQFKKDSLVQELKEAIIFLNKKEGMKQTQIAKLLGVTRARVNHIVNPSHGTKGTK